jgi:parvulin-like peptidyl-prolyl isomerase
MIRVVLIAFFILSGCSFFSKNDVIVKVGDISFSEKYFADRLLEKLKNVDGLHIKNKDLIGQLSEQLEKELIEEAFFFQWAQKKNLQIDRSDLVAFIGTQGTMNNGAPTDFIFEAAPTQNLLQNHIRLQIIKNHLFASFEKNLNVSEDEILALFKEKSPILSPAKIHLKQILISNEEDAQAVLQKILSGASFEDMAKKFSLSPEGAIGGELNWIDVTSTPQLKQLLSYNPGLINKIFSGPGGFYIYKIIESKKASVQSYQQVKEELRKTLIEKKRSQAYLQWLEEQVKTTKVLSNEKLIRTITSHYQETL